MKIKERLCQWGRFIRDNQNGLFKIAILLFLLDWSFCLWAIREDMPNMFWVDMTADRLGEIRQELFNIHNSINTLTGIMIRK